MRLCVSGNQGKVKNMKDKVLLEVLLPATQREYEFRVPYDAMVEEASRLMSRILASREPARYVASDGVNLVFGGTREEDAGKQLNPNETMRALVEQGVLVDGSSVILV